MSVPDEDISELQKVISNYFNRDILLFNAVIGRNDVSYTGNTYCPVSGTEPVFFKGEMAHLLTLGYDGIARAVINPLSEDEILIVDHDIEMHLRKTHF